MSVANELANKRGEMNLTKRARLADRNGLSDSLDSPRMAFPSMRRSRMICGGKYKACRIRYVPGSHPHRYANARLAPPTLRHGGRGNRCRTHARLARTLIAHEPLFTHISAAKSEIAVSGLVTLFRRAYR
ncbi:MAG TPA: hypothetical protein VGN31_07605 [Paraburkholderia sp.]|jgi:hypothetical protein